MKDSDQSTAGAKPTFRAVPEGVVELTGLGADGGIVELRGCPGTTPRFPFTRPTKVRR